MGSGADSPCQGEMARRARGGRVGDYEHEVLIRSRPRRRFGDFAAVGKVTRRRSGETLCTNYGDNHHRPLIRPFGPTSPRGGSLEISGETEFRTKFFAKLSYKKAEKRSHPVIGTRASGSLRGATQFQSGRAAPSGPRVAAGEPRLSPGPLVAPSLAGSVSVGSSQPGAEARGTSLCPAVSRLLMRRRGGER